jgi:hypothetical protein
MPEIGALSNKTISKLAGVAPLANDSGKHQGKRRVRGGRAAVREILFVVASVAGRYEPTSSASSSGSRRLANPAKSSASQWPTSCWSASTRRRAKCASAWQPLRSRARRPLLHKKTS